MTGTNPTDAPSPSPAAAPSPATAPSPPVPSSPPASSSPAAPPVTPEDSVVVRAGTLSVLLPRRSALAGTALGLVVFLLVSASVLVGSSDMSPPAAAQALLGVGDPLDVLLVQEFRLPRIVAGLLCGAALGTAGCLTQTLSGNRLATPDLLGVNGGATAAVLLSVTGTGAATLGQWWLGPVGAAAAAALVVLAAGGTGTRGHRILVVGLGLSTVTNALVQLAMARENLQSAGGLFVWSLGSLNGRDYAVAGPVGLCLAVLLPLAVLAGRQLAVLRFDDEVALSLGVRLRRVRLLVLLLAVALAGLSVGIAGPVGFLAMAAPILAARLTGPARVPVVGSALLGAGLVVAADTLGRVVAPAEIPVGVVTGVLGGPFLLWVLFGDTRTAPSRKA